MKEIYTCVIVDDEPAAHLVLVNYIRKEPRLQLVAQCYNIPEAMQYLQQHGADLLFLDIDLPEISGLEFLHTAQVVPSTILTTAYSQYAVESYDYGVLDYLLKPIAWPRFQRAITRFISRQEPAPPVVADTITIKVDGEEITLQQTAIDYIQSFGNYVRVYIGTKFYLAATTTQEILSHLSPAIYLRIHKSYIVNLAKISAHAEKEVTIGSARIPIGITFKRELFSRLVP